MDTRHLVTLEFPQVLARLAAFTSFSAGEALAHALTPETRPREIRWLLDVTGEARAFLQARPEIGMGGVHDVRPLAESAQRGATLPPPELLDVRDTIVAARNLHRTLTRQEEQFPRLAYLAGQIQLCPGLITEVNRCLDGRGAVRDGASPELARIRRAAQIAHGRIQDKLQRIITSARNAPFLQEAIVTQREGRYVIPLKSDFKGRIKGIVHDVSASGATTFIEPLAVVELNNAWRELQLAEQQEVNRILAHLSALVAERAAEIGQTVEALAELDLAFARARYAEAIEATAPEILPGRPALRFISARHPLLDPRTVVPVDLVLDGDTSVLVITGPNTGGKTVSLKTAGLLVLMAQAGMHLPVAPGSAFSPFEAVYADIGDEQSIEQSLSTFSSHLTNIVSFLDRAGSRSLVLLDELGAGTDPAEGAALAHALLEHFRQCGALTLVATHYPELKSYAQLTPGVCNGSVEFDSETLSPTYKLTIGLPGRSNAFAIARRLGLPEKIVAAARQRIAPGDLRTEDMLADIHRLRIQEARSRDAANAARAEVVGLERELRERLAGIDLERREILEQAREEAAREMETLQTQVRELRRRLQAAAAPLGEAAQIAEDVRELQDQLAEPEEASIHVSAAPSPGVRLDLRGCTVEEALQRLDRHLDAAARAGLPWVRIIHGKGSGALRRAVRDFLGDYPLISGYEPGGDREGGAGVTVAKLTAG